MSKATPEQMEALHGLVCEKLAEKLASGEATAADFGAAIKMLQNNGIVADPAKNPNAGRLLKAVEQFPFNDDEDDPDAVRSVQ